MSKKELTPKQKLFCEEYLVGHNATQAAISAGYSEHTAHSIGHENLSKPEIKNYLSIRQKQNLDRLGITQEYVLKTIKDVVENTKAIAPILDRNGNRVKIINEDGEEVEAYTVSDPKSVLKGAELLGKHLKLFTENVSHNHTFTQMGKVQTEQGDYLTFNVGEEVNDQS